MQLCTNQDLFELQDMYDELHEKFEKYTYQPDQEELESEQKLGDGDKAKIKKLEAALRALTIADKDDDNKVKKLKNALNKMVGI